MALCPAGHESQTNDYCDTCGALMGGAPMTPAAEPAGTAVLPEESGAAASAAGPCPHCGAARDGRFCEECGFDFELAELVPPAAASAGAATPEASADPLAATTALPPGYDLDAEFEAAERAFAESGGASATPAPVVSTSPVSPTAASANAGSAETSPGSVAEPSAQQPAETSAPALVALVTADQEYYTAQVERGDIVEAEFPFPRYPGERRFALEADRVRIGRTSASRGIAVEIDLTGPPLDPAVSHLHAQLLRGPDGAWALVDLNSANGTRLNGSADPLPAETEVPVKAGDRIHLGVWTTLVLEEA